MIKPERLAELTRLEEEEEEEVVVYVVWVTAGWPAGFLNPS